VCDTVKVLNDKADDGNLLLKALVTDLGNSVFIYSGTLRPCTKKHNKDVREISQREYVTRFKG